MTHAATDPIGKIQAIANDRLRAWIGARDLPALIDADCRALARTDLPAARRAEITGRRNRAETELAGARAYWDRTAAHIDHGTMRRDATTGRYARTYTLTYTTTTGRHLHQVPAAEVERIGGGILAHAWDIQVTDRAGDDVTFAFDCFR